MLAAGTQRQISGSGGITIGGSGALSLSASTNNYSGATIWNSTNQFNILNANAFGSSSSITFNSGTVSFNFTGVTLTNSNTRLLITVFRLKVPQTTTLNNRLF